MFIESYDLNIINVDNMANILLETYSDNVSIIARSPKAVKYDYQIVNIPMQKTDTTNGMGDQFYNILNRYHKEYYIAKLFSELNESIYQVDLENGIITVPNKDEATGNYISTIDDNGIISYDYEYGTEYKILFDKDGNPYYKLNDNNIDYYILYFATVVTSQNDDGSLSLIKPDYIVHLLNYNDIYNFIRETYDNIKEAIFDNTNISVYSILKDWYDKLFIESTIEVYDVDGNPLPSRHLLVNNLNEVVLDEDGNYMYITDIIVIKDPISGETIEEVVPLRLSKFDYYIDPNNEEEGVG